MIDGLYQGVLDRFPDGPGMDTQLQLLANGMDLPSLVRGIRHSPEAGAALLRSTDLAYLGQHLWRGPERRNAEAPMYFLHIMKTGGTALIEGMTGIAGPRFCLTQIFLDHLVLIPALVLESASLVAGHLGVEALDWLADETVTATVIREPVERALSHYAHVKADPALEAETAELTLDEFVHSPRWQPFSSNFQARNLVHRRGVAGGLAGAWRQYSPKERLGELSATAPSDPSLPLQTLFDHCPIGLSDAELEVAGLDRLDSIELVGTTEHLGDLFRRMAARWGVSEPPPLALANVSHGRTTRDQLGADLRRAILEANSVDLALYERARQLEPAPAARRRPARPPITDDVPLEPAGQGRSRSPVPALATVGRGRRPNAPLALGVLIAVAVSIVDTLVGGQVILIDALVAAPCCALAARRWLPTATAGAVAVVLGLAISVPDGIWATSTQYALLGVVVAVSVVATAMAAALERRLRGDRRLSTVG